MVNVCANPTCNTVFTTLNEGDLYAFEKRSANTEFFWLCSACVPLVALLLDLTGSVSVESKLICRLGSQSCVENRLRLVHSSLEARPWSRAGVAREFSPQSDLPSSSQEAA